MDAQQMTCSSRSSKQLSNFVSGVNLSEWYFTHIILTEASQFSLLENYFDRICGIEFVRILYVSLF